MDNLSQLQEIFHILKFQKLEFLMKKLLSIISALFLSVATAHGHPNDNENALKFGFRLAPRISSNIRHMRATSEVATLKSALPVDFILGIFGEYTINDKLGGQVTLEYYRSTYSIPESRKKVDDNATGSCITYAAYHHIMLKATPRYYVDKNRQFCLFAGPELIFVGMNKSANQSFRLEVVFGANYEFENGIILGLDHSLGLDGSSVLGSFSLFNNLTIGYNFAKLL